MITTIRTLFGDLVARRLWPVALLLVVALAAVPVVLGRGGDAIPAAAVPPTPAAGATSAAPEKAAVTLDTSAPANRDRSEHFRNPFRAPAQHAPTTAAAATTPAAAVPATPSASTPTAPRTPSAVPSRRSASPASPAPTGSASPSSAPASNAKPKTPTTNPKPSPAKPKPSTAAPKANDPTDTYYVSLRFGRNAGKLTTLRDIARLSPLPSVTDPFFVYLGILETTTHKKRAVFLVSSDATPNGEGSCHPTKTDCESVELAVDETAFFDYTAPDGTVTQYQLELAGIHKTAVKSVAKATAAVARHSVAGAELLTDAAKRNVRAAAGARAYRYVPGAGLLVRAKRKHVTAKAAAAGKLIPGLALLSRKLQPGIAVWRSPKP